MTIHSTSLPPPGGRRQRRRRETRERIFRAALRLFAERGFVATTVEDITEAVDVGKGTFFNYFPSKEHLLAAFAEVQLSKLQELASPSAQTEPLERTLRRLLYRLAEEPGRSPALVRGLLMALVSSESVRHVMGHNLERGRRILTKFLAARQARGEIRRDVSAAEIARGFQRMFFGTLVLWAVQPSAPLRSRLSATFPLYWSGISPANGKRGGK